MKGEIWVKEWLDGMKIRQTWVVLGRGALKTAFANPCYVQS